MSEVSAPRAQDRAAVILLLDDPSLALTQLGLPSLATPSHELMLGARRAELWIGAEPYPERFIDRRRLPKDIEPSAAWIAIVLDAVELDRGFRDMLGTDAPDPWAEGGELRALTALVRSVLPLAHALVLPKAGGVAISKEEWLSQTTAFADPRARPFRAWIDVHFGVGGTNPPTHLEIHGMSLFGLPSPRIAVGRPEERWFRDRALEALLLSAQAMVHQIRALEEGERFTVPIGARIGAYPLEEQAGDAQAFRVRTVDGDPSAIELVPERPLEELLGLWTERPEAIGPNTYATLFEAAMLESLGAQQVASLSPEALPPHVPPHHVVVLELPARIGGFLTLTQGLGRRPRPGTKRSDPSRHLELVIWSEMHSPKLASLLSVLAAAISTYEGPLASGDRLELEEPPELRWFTVGFAREVPLGGGRAVHLFEVFPLTEAEHAALDDARAQALIEALRGDQTRGREQAKLWLRLNRSGLEAE